MSSDCCCDDRHRTVYLVQYWVLNVRHCQEDAYLGTDYQAYSDDFDQCGLETWLLNIWGAKPENQGKVKAGDQKYLRIKVHHIGEWPTMDDCCGNRDVDVLKDISETLKSYRPYFEGKAAAARSEAPRQR